MTKREGKRARAGAQTAQQIESQDKLIRRPDVEARRKDYQRLAGSLLTMIELEMERAPSCLDAARKVGIEA